MVNGTDLVNAEAIAKDHAKWLVGLIEKVFVDAFVHGFKHGVEFIEEHPHKKE